MTQEINILNFIINSKIFYMIKYFLSTHSLSDIQIYVLVKILPVHYLDTYAGKNNCFSIFLLTKSATT